MTDLIPNKTLTVDNKIGIIYFLCFLNTQPFELVKSPNQRTQIEFLALPDISLVSCLIEMTMDEGNERIKQRRHRLILHGGFSLWM